MDGGSRCNIHLPHLAHLPPFNDLAIPGQNTSGGGGAGRARLRAGGDWPGGLGFNIHPTSGMEACSHVSNLARALFVLGRDKSIKRMVDDTRRSRVTGGTS